MTRATGVGSHPGDDQQAYDDALRLVLDTLTLAYLPEVPGRGAIASMTGRALAVVPELGFDLQPAGWRLTGGGSGIDHRRAQSLLGQDLDALEERADGFDGVFKTQVAGPWTLAATVEKPRGDRVLSDHGARRDLAEAFAIGVADHLADLRRRLPKASGFVVQIDEPVLPAVMGGRVPTASGFGRHRTVHPPEVSAALGLLTGLDAQVWLHSCASGVDWQLVRGAGFGGLSLDLAQLAADDLDVVAEALEAGTTVAFGVVASVDAGSALSEKAIVEKVLRLLDMLGLDPEAVMQHVAVTPACGLAGATATYARQVLALVERVAGDLGSESPEAR